MAKDKIGESEKNATPTSWLAGFFCWNTFTFLSDELSITLQSHPNHRRRLVESSRSGKSSPRIESILPED
jgi:hypothetical protein